MKKKILIGMMIIILFITNLCIVQAYSGEIDPENYITLPSVIHIQDKVGTGTIKLSSSASGYNISYQKIDITTDKLNELQNKANQANTYISEQKTIKKQKETELTTLQSEYTKLQSSGTATEEELTVAKNAYNTAYTEYKTFIDTINTEIQRLQSEYYAVIPNYTSSWQTATNSTNNVQLDFSNYSGMANFVLWVKITNGTNTYYDVGYYSTTIKEETDGNTEQTTGDWTDFSKAKFTLVKNGRSGAIVEATGVTANEKNTYYLYIANNANKPDVSKITDDEKIHFTYSTEKGKFIADSDKIARKVELNQDLYAVVIEYNNAKGIDNIVSYGTKLTRYDEARYNDAFQATFMTYQADQIVTTFTHAEENDRKIQIKIGKITDTSILKKLKNKDSSAFSDLMNFAKSNNGIYDQTLSADKDAFSIEYNAGTGTSKNNSVIKLSGLENQAYYYLYIKTDDENGKYISNEAVTLAQSSIPDDGKWYMFFYGTSDFKWTDWGTSDGDDTTVASGVLPQTGVSYAIISIIGIVVVAGVIFRIKYKKYDF